MENDFPSGPSRQVFTWEEGYCVAHCSECQSVPAGDGYGIWQTRHLTHLLIPLPTEAVPVWCGSDRQRRAGKHTHTHVLFNSLRVSAKWDWVWNRLDMATTCFDSDILVRESIDKGKAMSTECKYNMSCASKQNSLMRFRVLKLTLSC